MLYKKILVASSLLVVLFMLYLIPTKKEVEFAETNLEYVYQSVENLEIQLTEISELQEKQSNLLKKYEYKCKVLKWSLVISIPTTIIGTGIVYTALNSK